MREEYLSGADIQSSDSLLTSVSAPSSHPCQCMVFIYIWDLCVRARLLSRDCIFSKELA